MSLAPLGVALTAHWLRLDAILRLVRRADALGYAWIIVDGDAALADAIPGRPIYDATAVSSAALLATERAKIAAIHLPIFWNPVLLARSLATLQTLGGGRLVAFFGVGARRASARLGLPEPAAAEAVERLDALLDAVRPLLAGEVVTRRGRFDALERASITTPGVPVPIAISAAGPRALEVVRRHADFWDANVPPLRERLEPARARLGRDLPTGCWIFARPGASAEETARAYSRHAPWFANLAPADVARAVLSGEPAACRDKLARMREELDLALPIVDLAGLDEAGAAGALEALAPASRAPIS